MHPLVFFVATTSHHRPLHAESDFREKLSRQLEEEDKQEAKIAAQIDETESFAKKLKEMEAQEEEDIVSTSPAYAARQAILGVHAARQEYRHVLVDIETPEFNPYSPKFDELGVLAFLELLGAPVVSDFIKDCPNVKDAQGDVTIFSPTELMPTRRAMRDNATIVNHRFQDGFVPVEFYRAEYAYVLKPLVGNDFKCCVMRQYPRPFQFYVYRGDSYQKVKEWPTYPVQEEIELAAQNAVESIARGEL